MSKVNFVLFDLIIFLIQCLFYYGYKNGIWKLKKIVSADKMW